MRARCSARLRANSSGAWSARSMWSISEPPQFESRRFSASIFLIGVEALHGLVDVDFSPGDLLHQLDSTGGRGRGALDPDLHEQRVEPSPRRRVADAAVSLELFHLPPRPSKDAQASPFSLRPT